MLTVIITANCLLHLNFKIRVHFTDTTVWNVFKMSFDFVFAKVWQLYLLVGVQTFIACLNYVHVSNIEWENYFLIFIKKRIKWVAKSSKSCFVVQRTKDSALGFGLNPTLKTQWRKLCKSITLYQIFTF